MERVALRDMAAAVFDSLSLPVRGWRSREIYGVRSNSDDTDDISTEPGLTHRDVFTSCVIILELLD